MSSEIIQLDITTNTTFKYSRILSPGQQRRHAMVMPQNGIVPFFPAVSAGHWEGIILAHWRWWWADRNLSTLNLCFYHSSTTFDYAAAENSVQFYNTTVENERTTEIWTSLIRSNVGSHARNFWDITQYHHWSYIHDHHSRIWILVGDVHIECCGRGLQPYAISYLEAWLLHSWTWVHRQSTQVCDICSKLDYFFDNSGNDCRVHTDSCNPLYYEILQ